MFQLRMSVLKLIPRTQPFNPKIIMNAYEEEDILCTRNGPALPGQLIPPSDTLGPFFKDKTPVEICSQSLYREKVLEP
ncbi:hypothetical protein SUGI_1126190 [Cryptomeria japonica]|nr:hypothetical protein SUGI_1126190 [Cryptomeria japonica]